MIRLHETFRALFYAPLYAALARGDFSHAGVEVALICAPRPDAAIAAVLDGSADVAWGGPMRVIGAHRDDPACDVQGFAEFVCRDPFLLLGRGANPGFRPADLAGMRLGVVGEVPTPWLCLQQDLRLAGIDPARVAVRHGFSMAGNGARLLAGEIDVAQVLEPAATQLEAEGCTLWHAAAARGRTAYTCLYARRATIATRRAEMQALTAGLAASLRFAASAPPTALAAAIAPFFADLAPDVMTRALARYRRLRIWPNDPRPSATGYARLARALESGGFTPRAPGFARAMGGRAGAGRAARSQAAV